MIHNIYDATESSHLLFNTRANTRGNSYKQLYKLLNHTFYYDLRKHFFSTRVVNIWNNCQILLLAQALLMHLKHG